MLGLTYSDRQKSIISAALTLLSVVAIIAVLSWMAKLVLGFFMFFSSVFLPLAVAAILATLMKPYYESIHRRVKSRSLSVAVVILSLTLPFIVLSYYFGVLILSQFSSFLSELPEWIGRVQSLLQERMPAIKDWVAQVDLRARLVAFLQGRVDMLTSSAAALGQGVVMTGSAIFSKVASLLSWAVMPIYFAFLLQAPAPRISPLEGYLPFLKPETRRNVVYLATEFMNILVAFFRGQFLVAICQGLLFAIGFSLCGLPHGFVLGILLGLLNIIPYLGNIVGLAVVIPLAWFHPQGGMALLASVGVVFVVVQCIEGYLLTPRIMGQKTGLHPIVIIFAILFWGTALGGLLGMILAIPLTAFLVVFWRLLKTHYIKELL